VGDRVLMVQQEAKEYDDACDSKERTCDVCYPTVHFHPLLFVGRSHQDSDSVKQREPAVNKLRPSDCGQVHVFPETGFGGSAGTT
jgi:hypothetical protein